MSCSKASYWNKIVNSEIGSIINNLAWEQVNLPSGNKLLAYK